MDSLKNKFLIKKNKLKYKKTLNLQNKKTNDIISYKRDLSKFNFDNIKRLNFFIKKNNILKKILYPIKRAKNYKSTKFSLNYLIPITALFFLTTSFILSINDLKNKSLICSLHIKLKKKLISLLIMRKILNILRHIKIMDLSHSTLIFKINFKCKVIEYHLLKMLTEFRNIFFTFLKEIQLIHFKNFLKINLSDNVSILKQNKIARWLKRNRFKKINKFYFNNFYTKKIVKSICSQVFLNFNKISKYANKNAFLKEKVHQFLKASEKVFFKKPVKKLIIKKYKIRNIVRFSNWKWLNRKLKRNKKLKIVAFRQKKFNFFIKRHNLTSKWKTKIFKWQNKIKFYGFRNKRDFRDFRWRRNWKKKLLFKKFKKIKISSSLILNFLILNQRLVVLNNPLFYNKIKSLSHPKFSAIRNVIKTNYKNMNKFSMPTNFLINKKQAFLLNIFNCLKLSKKTYNTLLINFKLGNSLVRSKIFNIQKDIINLQNQNYVLYDKIKSYVDGNNIFLTASKINKNDKLIWIKKQWLNSKIEEYKYHLKSNKKKSIKFSQRARAVYPLNDDLKDVIKYNLKNLIASRKMPFYKKMQWLKKNFSLKKFSKEFANTKLLDSNIDTLSDSNNFVIKSQSRKILNNFSKIYRRKLFKNQSFITILSRREFRLNLKNLINQSKITNLLIKSLTYNLNWNDIIFSSNLLNQKESNKAKLIFKDVLKLYGSHIQNIYTKKKSGLFHLLLRQSYRNSNAIKTFKRRTLSQKKIKYLNDKKFRINLKYRSGLIRKYKQINRKKNYLLEKNKTKNHSGYGLNKNLLKISKLIYLKTINKVTNTSLLKKVLINIKNKKTNIYCSKIFKLFNKNKYSNFKNLSLIRKLIGSKNILLFTNNFLNGKINDLFKHRNNKISINRSKLLYYWLILISKRRNKIKKLKKLSKKSNIRLIKFWLNNSYTKYFLKKNIIKNNPLILKNLIKSITKIKSKTLAHYIKDKKINQEILTNLNKLHFKRSYLLKKKRLFLIDKCIYSEILMSKLFNLVSKYLNIQTLMFSRRNINNSSAIIKKYKELCNISWNNLIFNKKNLYNHNLVIKNLNSHINDKKLIQLLIPKQNTISSLNKIKFIDVNKINSLILNLNNKNTKKLKINLALNDKTILNIVYKPNLNKIYLLLNQNSVINITNQNKPLLYCFNTNNIKRINLKLSRVHSEWENYMTSNSNKSKNTKLNYYLNSIKNNHEIKLNFLFDPIKILPREIWLKGNSNFWFENLSEKFLLKQYTQSKGLKNISYSFNNNFNIANNFLNNKKNILKNYWNNPLSNFKFNITKNWKKNLLNSTLMQTTFVNNIYKWNFGLKTNLNNKYGWLYNKIYIYNLNRWKKFKTVSATLKKHRLKKNKFALQKKNFIKLHSINSKYYFKNDKLINPLKKAYIKKTLLYNPTKFKIIKNINYKKNVTNFYKKRKNLFSRRQKRFMFKIKIFKHLNKPWRWYKRKQLKQQLIKNIKLKKIKLNFFKRLNKIQINFKSVEKNTYIWQTLYFWRILIEFLNFIPTNFEKFFPIIATAFGENLFPTSRLNTKKLNTILILNSAKLNEYNFSKQILSQLIKKTVYSPRLNNKTSFFTKTTNMGKRVFSTSSNNILEKSVNFQNKKILKLIIENKNNLSKSQYIQKKYNSVNVAKDNNRNILKFVETKLPKFFYWRLLAPKVIMIQDKKQRIAKFKYFNKKLKRFRWKKKKKKSLSLFFKFLGAWKRLYLVFKGKKKLEKLLPYIDGDIKVKSLKKFFSIRFILKRYFRTRFLGNVGKNKTIKIYNSVKRLQTNRFFKYSLKLRRHLIPALITMQLVQNASMASNLIKHGYVFVNGIRVNKINFIVKPFDLIMIFIPHGSHSYYTQTMPYFAKNINTNISRVNSKERPTNFINGAVFPSRFFLINLKLGDWFKFMHFWTAFNSIRSSFYHLSRFENTSRLFGWRKGFYGKPPFLKRGRKRRRASIYPKLLKKRIRIEMTEKLWFLKKSAINRFWNRLIKKLIFFSNCYIIFGFYFDDFHLSNKKGLKKLYRNNVTNLTMHLLKQYR